MKTVSRDGLLAVFILIIFNYVFIKKRQCEMHISSHFSGHDALSYQAFPIGGKFIGFHSKLFLKVFRPSWPFLWR